MKNELPNCWREERLGDIAEIIVSNVDKKSYENDAIVSLCNYMDVYNNNYINSTLTYMEATATSDEIKKFSLKTDDVIITKDSETPDDIAVPAVVTEQMENLVCGYHLAILRPKSGIFGRFLFNQIASNKVHYHFVSHANGATRFGLTLPDIKKALILLPPIEEQRKIAEILGTVDEKINGIDRRIKEAEKLKKGLMQKLFNEGIGHTEFKTTELGTLPASWGLKTLQDIATIKSGSTPLRAYGSEYYSDLGYSWVKTLDLNNGKIYQTHEKITQRALDESHCCLLPVGTVLIAMYGGFNQIGRTGLLMVQAAVNQAISALVFSVEITPEYVLFYLNAKVKTWKTVAASSRKDPNITKKDVENFKIPLPPIEEQKKIAEILTEADNKIEHLKKLKDKYALLKKGLMQQLTTGQKRVVV